jgi:endogenous inhibitor of DNA gyrase (YacG/DUF329 family)
VRRKPVTRDEVRIRILDGQRISTMPADSVHKAQLWSSPEPIDKLWKPLLRQLGNAKLPEYGFRLRECWQCERQFYTTRFYFGHYCSDRCQSLAYAPARAAQRAAMVKAKSKARAAARADRECETCGKPIEAKRSTMRFCSVKCRVAAHRELDKEARGLGSSRFLSERRKGKHQ